MHASPTARAPRPFTGWHATAILVAFFAVVIAVNIGMARLAIHTFSGVVVQNSYDASQSFNGWLKEAAREKALGWDARATRLADGRVAVSIARDGATPIPAGVVLSADAIRPLGKPEDHAVAFTRDGADNWASTVPLAPGRWKLRLTLSGKDAAGKPVLWRDEASFF
ncbi:MAG: FixH family protein [Sphingomonadales bacterium]|nr:FixH family protein [Sphingomonadales bacterium]